MNHDRSSLSNPHEVRVTHLDWNMEIDFEQKILKGSATYTLAYVDTDKSNDTPISPPSSPSSLRESAVQHLSSPSKALQNAMTYLGLSKGAVLCLDTNGLVISRIVNQDGNELVYKLSKVKPTKPHLGQQLCIRLKTKQTQSDNKVDDEDDDDEDVGPLATSVTIYYQTTAQGSTAIQWLPAVQTVGKQHPYLFTQCQAIHARSLVPCQDTPGAKFTYHATMALPLPLYEWATCIMSAVLKKEYIREKPHGENGSSSAQSYKVFEWEQNVPISSYLLAMAVGELSRLEISDRCAVWSEPSIVDAVKYEFGQTEDFLSIAESIAGTPYSWGRYDLLCLPPSCPYGGMENPCLTFVTPTLLAGDRSLADVVAHEIAHSWTGNLVTNTTWDHFWLNEGWTTWFQRKIMARIHENDLFLDFDALGGVKALQDTVEGEMPRKFTALVLDIGDGDPDDAYSSVAYERGFTLLITLERSVVQDSEAFEHFFQAYVSHYSNTTVTTEEFRRFFTQYFEKKGFQEVVDRINSFDWDAWFYEPGMPPTIPDYDRSMAEASEDLAQRWFNFDRNNQSTPADVDISTWSSGQTTCFLDALQLLLAGSNGASDAVPLKVKTIREMDKMYAFTQTKNAEILFRYCQLAIMSEDETILPVVTHFITSQGRMKFVRPLYRALHASSMGRALATQVFLEHKDFYHPICAKMIASDLLVTYETSGATVKGDKSESLKEKINSLVSDETAMALIVAAVGIAAVGVIVLFNGRRKA